MQPFAYITAMRPHRERGDLIRARAAWVMLGGGPGYFSITGELFGSARVGFERPVVHEGKPRWMFACGAIHSDIAETFPELANTVRWHLVGETGPMHYIENAAFWMNYVHGCAKSYNATSGPQYTPARAETAFREHVIFGVVAGDEMPEFHFPNGATDDEKRRIIRNGTETWCEARLPGLVLAFSDEMSRLAKVFETI